MLSGLKGAVTTITSPGPTKDMVACFAMFYGAQPPHSQANADACHSAYCHTLCQSDKKILRRGSSFTRDIFERVMGASPRLTDLGN